MKKAQREGQVSRAHYKLEELQERYRLLQGGHHVLELGAAPGGWTNFIESKLSNKGGLIAVDPLPITAGAHTHVIAGLAGSDEVDQAVEAILATWQGLDLVLSDMAPNMSGVRAVDQARAMELADVALNACQRWLKRGGNLALKSFQGEGFDAWVRDRRAEFKKVTVSKPKASRSDSREVFVVAQGFKGLGDG